MDTPETVAHVSLCAGYGGIDLGLKRAIPSLRTVAFSEIEAFACANLVAKMEAGLMDAAPVWTDVKTFPWEQFRGKVGILSGGYPCQPFSSAGKRLGACDPRHLWPHIADGIARMQPGLCFFENVEGHISLGLENVLRELQGLGYRCAFGIFSAAEVGAPHQRKRVFILANRDGAGLQGWHGRVVRECADEWAAWPSRPSIPQHEWEPPRVVGDATRLQRNGCDDNAGSGTQGRAVSESRDTGWQICMGEPMQSGLDGATRQGLHGAGGASLQFTQGRGPQSERQAQPTLGRDADGPAGWLDYAELCRASDNRTDELRLLGNGVVPATAERAFRVLCKRLLT